MGSTLHVESDNSTIQSTALNIVSGKSTLKGVVKALARWIAGYISYDHSNTYKKSTDVLSNRTGDCEGQSYLMAAFCKSLGIPARITYGNSFRYETKLPLWNGMTYIISQGSTGTVTNGTIGHSLYEFFYPQTNSWVRGDGAQPAINTGWSTMIKSASGQDDDIQRLAS